MGNRFDSWGYSQRLTAKNNIQADEFGTTNNMDTVMDGALKKIKVEPSDNLFEKNTEADKGIDFDLSPNVMEPIERKKIIITPERAIEITVRSMSRNGNRFLENNEGSGIDKLLRGLREHIINKEKLDFDTQRVYDKSELFRHFIHMLKSRILGCNGVFDKNVNKIYIVSKPDMDNKDLYRFDNKLLYRGVPAVVGFSKPKIDAVGEIFRTGVIASEYSSLYDHLVKESGYVDSRNQIKAMDRNESGMADKMVKYTYGRNDLEIANMIVSSEKPSKMLNIVAKELKKDENRMHRILDLIEYGTK